MSTVPTPFPTKGLIGVPFQEEGESQFYSFENKFFCFVFADDHEHIDIGSTFILVFAGILGTIGTKFSEKKT